MPVRARTLGLLLLATLVGVGGGLGAGYLRQPQPATGGTASPLPATSPSVPIDPPPTVEKYDPDIDFPPLQPGIRLSMLRMGNSVQSWNVPYPEGWASYDVRTDDLVLPRDRRDYDELRWRPADEPIEGGYSLRVKTVNDHVTTDLMVAERIRLVIKAYGRENVEYTRTEDSVRFIFRDGNNRKRYNYFRYFAGPGSSEASLEMSVAGRETDVPGLDWLFSVFDSTLVAVS